MAALAVAGVSPSVAAEGRCKCPTISAEAKGNSSCSGTETGNLCTINFNRFPDQIENRAADYLSKIIPNPLGFPPGKVSSELVDVAESADVLAATANNSETDEFNQLLLTYLFVSVASREDASGIFDRDNQFISTLVGWVENNSLELRSLFARGTPPVKASSIELDGLTLTLSPGCIEAKSKDLWVMYKTYWAHAAQKPQCGDGE